MEFGVGLGRELSINEVAEHAQVADECSFSHATFVNIDHVAREVNVMMTVAALNSRQLRIGQGVTDPSTYHPAAIANSAATLRELSGGRSFVGLGTGRGWGKPTKSGLRMDDFRQAIAFIKAFTAGDEAEYQGDRWHSEWIRGSQWVGQSIPVYAATSGPVSCEIAGEVADGAFMVGLDPELIKWRLEHISKGAAKAGRDPSAIELWLRTQTYVAASKEEALKETAPYAATCAYEFCQQLRSKHPAIGDLRRLIERRHPGLLDEFQRIYDAWDPYQIEAIDGPQANLTSQRVVDFFLLTGTSEGICERIEELQQLGVRRLSTVMFAIQDQKAMMREVADKIMPHFA